MARPAGMAAALAVMLLLASCGGGGSGAGVVVVRVGPYAVTKAMLNEWMLEKLGEDSFHASLHQVPVGLVLEPVNIPACAATVKTLRAANPAAQPLSRSVVAQKCHELYVAFKQQALEYLANTFWKIGFLARYGISVSDSQAQRALEELRTHQYPKPGEFQQLLQGLRRTPAQEQLLLKNELLSTQVKSRIFSHGTKAINAIVNANEQALAADPLHCTPGYLVTGCKGYQPPPPNPSHPDAGSPALLLEETTR